MKEILIDLYWYCTDFCVNTANFLGITYVEFNFWFFIVIVPVTLLFLILLNLFKNKIATLVGTNLEK